MAIALKDKWVWDSWYVRSGDKWHAFFLQADKSIGDPELRHWNVTQGHAVSDDLKNWEYLGTCFGPSETSSWDDYTTWTGSVVKGNDGSWHLFYTGTSRFDGGNRQRIGHATCDDLHSWRRVGDGCALRLDAKMYEDFDYRRWNGRAFRDPWVIKDPDGEGWLMFITARGRGIESSLDSGAIGLARSDDLYEWRLNSPVYVGEFGELEVPQVFRVENRWYCLFCVSGNYWSQRYADSSYHRGPVTGTHYLTAHHPLGPWRVARGLFLDGDAVGSRYASRIVVTDDGMKLLGFWNNPGGAGFVGEICDPVTVKRLSDGRLKLETKSALSSLKAVMGRIDAAPENNAGRLDVAGRSAGNPAVE